MDIRLPTLLQPATSASHLHFLFLPLILMTPTKVVDVALVEEVEAVVVEEQGPDDSPPPQPK